MATNPTTGRTRRSAVVPCVCGHTILATVPNPRYTDTKGPSVRCDNCGHIKTASPNEHILAPGEDLPEEHQ